MKPVTELYEAAESAYRGAGDRRLGEAVLKFDIDMGDEHEPNRDMLEVLDLVATLPPERLGLVRWVAGLGEEEQALLGQALANQQELVDEWAPEEAEDARRFVAMREGFVAAVSGGEGGAKEEAKPTTLPAGKPQTHTGPCVDYCACRSSSDVTARKTDCQACEWGMPMYDRQWRALPGRIWCRHQHEYDQMLGAAEKAQHVERRMLPAGKPPPFLRVGMVLAHGGLELELIEHGAEYRVPSWRCWSGLRGDKKGRRLAWWPTSWLEKMPLAEPFAVEGEEPAAPGDVCGKTCELTSPPMVEGRKRCTCNSSPSPRRCEGQSRLGAGWYCVEGKP